MRPILWLLISSGFLACVSGLEPAAEDFVDSFDVDGLVREYQVHLPAGKEAASDLPVIIALHGSGGSASQIRLSSGLDAVADEMGFVAVYPDGVPNWEVSDDGSVPDDVKFLRNMLDRLADRVQVDRNRVYATGMSRGGFMSHFLGCRMSKELAAVAPVAGGLLLDVTGYCKSDRPVGVLAIHGEDDSIVPIAGDADNAISTYHSLEDGLEFWARLNQCDAAVERTDAPTFSLPIERVAYSGCRNGVRVEGLRMTGVGHRWPQRTMDGSRVIAEFLLSHSK